VQPPPPPAAPPPISQPFVAPPTPVKDGPGAGVWIGIFGILLLVVGAGLWFYTTQTHKAATEQVAVAPVSPTPVPTPTPVSTFVPAPTPTATTEVIPPNPDQVSNSARPEAPKPSTAPKATVVPVTRPAPQVDPAPAPTPPVKTAPPTSGVLHAAVEVAQNGEVVFENLPGARLKFTFDHSAWQPTISHQPNGTQTLVMRSLKPGIQKTCDVRWEIVQ
jgi:outer membrane biosynthesis protein TonB